VARATRAGTARNHVTVNHLKIAFTSDAAAAAAWSSYFANGGFTRIASLQHTDTVVSATVRPRRYGRERGAADRTRAGRRQHAE